MDRPPLPDELLKRCRELRSSASNAEKRLWSCLRNRQLLGFKFRRQHPVGRFIVDFYCHEARLAIEIDGGQHAEEHQSAYDARRTELLQAKGIRVIRFWNNEVLQNLEGVLETIVATLCSLTLTLSQREREHEEEFDTDRHENVGRTISHDERLKKNESEQGHGSSDNGDSEEQRASAQDHKPK
jgi:very-short-patch-repair endonuclease